MPSHHTHQKYKNRRFEGEQKSSFIIALRDQVELCGIVRERGQTEMLEGVVGDQPLRGEVAASVKGFGCRPSTRRPVRRGRRPKASREGTRGVEVAALIYGDLTISREPLRPR